MKLFRVEYELFLSDEAYMNESESDVQHCIDREIRLVFEDAPSIYISWTSSPVQYAIGYQGGSFFEGKPEAVRDMTDSALWSKLVGSHLQLNFLDSDHQVLELRAGNAVVFCASFEQGWWADVVCVTAHLPPMPSTTSIGI